MIGRRYWTTGVKIRPYCPGKWSAEIDFLDDGFCDNKSTEGKLCTRYVVPLELAIDTVIADAKRLGIVFGVRSKHKNGVKPTIYVPGDGEGEEGKGLPKNWRAIVRKQCERLGWHCIY